MASSSDNRVVALLPLKANSERVRNKNFRPFNGQPLFRWVLNTLLGIDEIDQVVINTDARSELAACGLYEDDRILIRDRPLELRGDFVSMNHILANDVAHVKASTYIMTHTTNPLLTENSIRGAMAMYYKGLQEGNGDSVFAVNRVQTRFYRADGSAINHDPNKLARTQDLEPWFEDNSNLYVFSAASFASTAARIGSRPKMYEMASSESVDIDDQATWDMAEAIAQYRHR